MPVTTLPIDDWHLMVEYDRHTLLLELALTHEELAKLHETIAFTKITELENKSVRPQRINDEGHRDALIEKKFLIIRLLDAVA